MPGPQFLLRSVELHVWMVLSDEIEDGTICHEVVNKSGFDGKTVILLLSKKLHFSVDCSQHRIPP